MAKTINLQFKRRNFWLVLFVAAISLSFVTNAQNPEKWESLKGDISFFIANDLGRNGYYDQKPIAELMGVMAETIGPEAVVAAGDVHHFEGVASINDPLWMTNYELIYSHPELMISWLPILGNHEYRGNTQAVLDYSNVSRRWEMKDRYYSKVYDDNGVSIRLVLIDTTPLINRYHNNDTYRDVDAQDIETQLKWIDSTLKEAKEDWVIVVGHHPIYAQTKKSDTEQLDMQAVLLPILQRYKNKVDMYVCGHIHNFQHIRRGNDGIDFVVNSSASLARNVKQMDGTIFCSPAEGFSVLSATKEQLSLYMIDKNGCVIHEVKRAHK
ncbi:MAG: metallophosphoesterase [Candidatus Limisoma sp.]